VNKDINACGRRELAQCADNGTVGKEVAIKVSRLDVEDVDQNTNIAEDVLSLLR